MTRFEIKQGSILVAYGHDDFMGYFLTVSDERLKWEPNVPTGVNEVKEAQCSSGDGLIFALGAFGLHPEHKFVNHSTMAHFMALYGVPKEQVAKVKAGVPI